MASPAAALAYQCTRGVKWRLLSDPQLRPATISRSLKFNKPCDWATEGAFCGTTGILQFRLSSEALAFSWCYSTFSLKWWCFTRTKACVSMSKTKQVASFWMTTLRHCESVFCWEARTLVRNTFELLECSRKLSFIWKLAMKSSRPMLMPRREWGQLCVGAPQTAVSN